MYGNNSIRTGYRSLVKVVRFPNLPDIIKTYPDFIKNFPDFEIFAWRTDDCVKEEHTLILQTWFEKGFYFALHIFINILYNIFILLD